MVKFKKWVKSLLLIAGCWHSCVFHTDIKASIQTELSDPHKNLNVFINKLSQLEKIEITTDNISRLLNKATLNLDSLNFDFNVSALNKIIERVLRDQIAFPVTVQILIHLDQFTPLEEAFSEITQQCSQPSLLKWSCSNKIPENKREENDADQYRLRSYQFSSRAKELEQIKYGFHYQISETDRVKIDFDNLYSLVGRSGFNLENFNYDRLRVRLLEVKSTAAQDCVEEINQYILDKLSKDSNPFHIFIIKFDINNPLKSHDIYKLFQTQKEYLYSNIGSVRGAITDQQNNCFYYCFDNHRRQQLDLHGQKINGVYKGKSVNYAREETIQFIRQAYHNFEDQITILTGRGNHINTNGQKGVLHSLFKTKWIKDDQVATLIKKCHPINGGGGYSITFVKVERITTVENDTYNILFKLKPIVEQMLDQNNKRLILTRRANSSDQINTKLIFNLMSQLPRPIPSMEKSFYDSLSPFSVDEDSTELRLIFNTRHIIHPYSSGWSTIFGQETFHSTLNSIHP